MLWSALAVTSAVVWLAILLLPWRPWGTREYLDSAVQMTPMDLSDVTVLIPARNEADSIEAVLESIFRQGVGLQVVLVDDQSSDETAEIAKRFRNRGLRLVSGEPLPSGWAGKLWALEQGRGLIDTRYTLLLDGDIALSPGILATLHRKVCSQEIQFASLMAKLRMYTFWERLLLPAFIYFFKLLYPFRLSNHVRFKKIAAAAGGCILLETGVLEEIGGFVALRDALIDDCTLAKRVKQRGYRTWVGLTHSAVSIRSYDRLSAIWDMVARTAFTQLYYSTVILIVLTMVFFVAFLWPILGLFVVSAEYAIFYLLLALIIMMSLYLPVLRFYRVSMAYAVLMPFIGTLFLAMTWTSAIRYWLGRRSSWKGRVYNKTLDSEH